MSVPNQAKTRRIAVLGARAVGKSSLVIQFCENHFVDSYYPTIENTFTKTIKYRGNGKKLWIQRVKMNILFYLLIMLLECMVMFLSIQ
ncbi:Putative GTP-binding protein rhb1 [Rhizopus microsporus]|nr:Putative GTP-binding protein rhb1 [Rhizopus microsporus]